MISATQLSAATDERTLTPHCGLKNVLGVVLLGMRKNIAFKEKIWDIERVQDVCGLDAVLHDSIGGNHQQRDGGGRADSGQRFAGIRPPNLENPILVRSFLQVIELPVPLKTDHSNPKVRIVDLDVDKILSSHGKIKKNRHDHKRNNSINDL